MPDRLKRSETDEIKHNTRRGVFFAEGVAEKMECWTPLTETHTVPMFALFQGREDADYPWYLRVQSGNGASSAYLGLDETEFKDVVASMELNPGVTRHRSPGKLLEYEEDDL